MSSSLTSVTPSNSSPGHGSPSSPKSPFHSLRYTIVSLVLLLSSAVLTYLYYPRVKASFDHDTFLSSLTEPGSIHVTLPSGSVTLTAPVPVLITNKTPMLTIKAQVKGRLFYGGVTIGEGGGGVDVPAGKTKRELFDVTQIVQDSSELQDVAGYIVNDCGACLLPWSSACEGVIEVGLEVEVEVDGFLGGIIGVVEIEDVLEVECDDILN